MDGMPEIFSTREAFTLLDWQGSRQGLARHLQASGFELVTARQPNGHGTRRMWRRPEGLVAAPTCACRCHTGTCGANDMVLAERTIRLIEKLRPYSEEAIMQIVDLVHRAGVDHASAALDQAALDADVPF
jgi:hypothetical protein